MGIMWLQILLICLFAAQETSLFLVVVLNIFVETMKKNKNISGFFSPIRTGLVFMEEVREICISQSQDALCGFNPIRICHVCFFLT